MAYMRALSSSANRWKVGAVVISFLLTVYVIILWSGHDDLVVNVSNYAKSHMQSRIRNLDSISYTKSSKPNVIFILSDDLGWNDVGYHNSEINTPTIDRLAKEGVRLENYYAQSKCTPSRASFMTGLYQSRSGVDRALLTSEAACLPTNLPVLPEVLKQYGYTTHLVGKWHLGWSRRECLPNQRGFDTFLGFNVGAEDYYKHRHGFMKSATLPGVKFFGFDFWENETISDNYTGQYSTHVFINRAEEIIAEHAQNGEPMFMFLSLSAVHTPLQVPEEYTKQYEGTIEDKNRRIYAGMASCMDEGIHNLTDTLQRHNLWENTVLIFSSDNGGHTDFGASNYPLKGRKSQFYEGGIRVASFVRSPLLSNHVKGTKYNGLMGIADWFPTIVEGIAEGTKEYTVDGVNTWNSIRYGLPSPRTEYLHAVGGNCDWEYEGKGNNSIMYGTIRVGEWKLLLGHKEQNSICLHEEKEDVLSEENRELYNIRVDPYEKENLFDSEHDIRTKLIQILRYHCRRRVTYLPLVERKEASPLYRNGIFSPWLEDWDDLEWNATKDDLKNFTKAYYQL